MVNGVCKWFSATKGYGFLTGEDGKDIFVHYQQLQMDGFKTLNEGDKVTFDIVDCDRGVQAVNVQKVTEE